MTPAARVAAAIEVLDRVLAGTPAEQALIGWARASRFAGSGDRAAVRDHVFGALRCRRSFGAMSGVPGESGRALMLGSLVAASADPTSLFTGEGHAPAALTSAERAALASAPTLADLPEAVRLDCPDWLMEPLREALSDQFDEVMALQRQRAPVFLRVNLRKTTREGAHEALLREGILNEPHPLAQSALLVLDKSSKINGSMAYAEGLVELQDGSSQAAVEQLPLADGMEVLDFCAGGGGKALAMAARCRCRLVAHDVAPQRMADLPGRARRAGVSVDITDKAALKGKSFDLVLVDAPCSGSGTWRRTPDAKWRLTPERLAELTHLQDEILGQALQHLRPGGALAYMTCSFLRAENEDRVAGLLARFSGLACEKMVRFSPVDGGDGFFLAQFRAI
jgi:16S rRNA (cytosine967-C5)-methyltransferase